MEFKKNIKRYSNTNMKEWLGSLEGKSRDSKTLCLTGTAEDNSGNGMVEKVQLTLEQCGIPFYPGTVKTRHINT